jgi:hypothetical protein
MLSPMRFENVGDDVFRDRLGRREKQVINDGVPAVNHRHRFRDKFEACGYRSLVEGGWRTKLDYKTFSGRFPVRRKNKGR